MLWLRWYVRAEACFELICLSQGRCAVFNLLNRGCSARFSPSASGSASGHFGASWPEEIELRFDCVHLPFVCVVSIIPYILWVESLLHPLMLVWIVSIVWLYVYQMSSSSVQRLTPQHCSVFNIVVCSWLVAVPLNFLFFLIVLSSAYLCIYLSIMSIW